MDAINETLNQKFENETLDIIKRYRPTFESVAASPNFANAGRSFTKMDAYYLGKQLDMYQMYEDYVHETASATDLGMLPKVATDLIAATYAISVAPLLASMQTIPEQQGIIYFKKVSASGMINQFPYTPNANDPVLGAGYGPQSRGGLNVGDSLVEAKRGWVGDAMQYATEQVMNEVLTDSQNATGGFTPQLRMFPIRGNVPVRLVCVDSAGNLQEGVFLNQEGGSSNQGQLMSAGNFWTGNITYSTGQINIDIQGTVGADGIRVSYMQDFETAADIPVIEMTLSSTDVMAEVLALKQNISTLKAFQFSQRFGRVAEDDALMDLAGTMADVESRRIIAGYVQMANWIERQSFSSGKPIRFAETTPAGLSDYEYRQGFRYAMVEADSAINLNCGRGAANRYIAGHRACEFISSLPKFEAAPANLAVGPHVFGYYDGKPVIRTTYMRGLIQDPTNPPTNDFGYENPNNVIIAAYLNPQSPFDAPIVEATYMPIFITNTMQFGHNPLQNMRAIASWKAFKNVVPHYTKMIVLGDNA
jgi:hypothetical protein